MSVSSIGEYIRDQREQAKISLRQLAAAAGVSNPYLSQIERGLRRPSAEILQQIAKGLRISAEALYVQAGILEERPPDSGVRAAVLAEPGLTERQKQVLLEIFDSFRKETAARAAIAAADEIADSAADEEDQYEPPIRRVASARIRRPGRLIRDDDDPLLEERDEAKAELWRTITAHRGSMDDAPPQVIEETFVSEDDAFHHGGE
jgi:transcriptional regulator with XRE-family HTH domain